MKGSPIMPLPPSPEEEMACVATHGEERQGSHLSNPLEHVSPQRRLQSLTPTSVDEWKELGNRSQGRREAVLVKKKRVVSIMA